MDSTAGSSASRLWWLVPPVAALLYPYAVKARCLALWSSSGFANTSLDLQLKQHSIHQYHVVRMNEAPPIEVHLARNGEGPDRSANPTGPSRRLRWATRSRRPRENGCASSPSTRG